MNILALSLLILSTKSQTAMITCDIYESSSTLDGSYQAAVTCPNDYDLISCGFRSADINATVSFGSMINGNNECIADGSQNVEVFAVARCCKAEGGIQFSCTSDIFGKDDIPLFSSANGIGGTVENKADCNSGEYLLSCSLLNDAGIGSRGAFPSHTSPAQVVSNIGVIDHTTECTTVVDNDSSTFGEAVEVSYGCCSINDNNVQLSCKDITVEVTDNNNTQEAVITDCTQSGLSSNAFMADCSGYTADSLEVIKYV